MAKRWWRIGSLMRSGELQPEGEIITHGSIIHFDRAWAAKMALNGFGALITAVVALIFLVTKFTGGAWMIVLLIPTLVWVFSRIHLHYRRVAQVLTTEGATVNLLPRPIETIVLVGDVHRETLRLVEFAISLGVPWKAVHIGVNEERTAEVQRKWQERVGIGELMVLKSPYRSLTRPLHNYVKRRLKQNPGGFIHVVLGELRTGNALTQVLHQNAHFIEQLALSDLNGVVTTVVPFPLEAHDANEAAEDPAGDITDGAQEDDLMETVEVSK
jgi:hypothetical protein